VIPEYINELLKNIRTENKTRHISSGLKELYDDIVARSNDPQTCFGLKTGIPTFDREFGGAQKGTCLLLSGRPGSGKSIFKNQIAINMAKEGHPGVVYELEMSEKNSLRRLLSAEANVSARNMKTGNMVDSDWERVTKSFETMSELPIHISESTSWTTAGIMSDLTRLKAIYGIEWFTLDYIGLVKDRVGKDITEKDGIVTESLHDICKNLNMFGLFVQSMNKQGFKEDVDGGMEDVAGGAKTHHTAEIITVMVKSDPKNNPSHVDWKFKKNRDADTWIDVIRLQWRKGYPYFEERMMLP
jgi:replicative DNA helicase